MGAGTGRGVHGAWAATCAAMCADGVGRGDSMGGVRGVPAMKAEQGGAASWQGADGSKNDGDGVRKVTHGRKTGGEACGEEGASGFAKMESSKRESEKRGRFAELGKKFNSSQKLQKVLKFKILSCFSFA